MYPAARATIASPVVPAITDLHARCVPPEGWTPRPTPASSRAQQIVWFSPSGETTYGVIYIPLPLPLGEQLVLWGFLGEMRQREKQAVLREKSFDRAADALRFVAEMPTYTMHGKLVVHGTSSWVMFASTANGRPIEQDKFMEARKAREATVTLSDGP